MKKTVKIIAAFAVGATAGSVLGLLLAPGKTGSGRNKAGVEEKAADDVKDDCCEKKDKKKE